MLRLIGRTLVVAVIALLGHWTYRQGWTDLVRSVSHLSYYPTRDMRRTVVILPQKIVVREPDSASVPVQGLPDGLTEAALAENRAAATAGIRNPTAAADLDSSIARGERKFMGLCSPCHGKAMAADGPVASSFMPPPDLLAEMTRARSDGYLYSYIRYGGVVMPRYGQAVTIAEIWDIVSFIRHGQKVSPR